MNGPLEPRCTSIIAAFVVDTRTLAAASVSSEWGIAMAARLMHSLLMPPALRAAPDGRQLDWRHSEVINLVTGCLTVKLLATAYDLVFSLRADAWESDDGEECWGRIALIIRDLLVLYVCSTSTSDSLSDVAFEDALVEAFNCPMLGWGPERRGQFHMARAAASRIGRDWISFQRQGPTVWGAMVTEEELKQMSFAYSACAASTRYGRYGIVARRL